MKIEQTITYPYAFSIGSEDEPFELKFQSDINSWLNENCEGRWIITQCRYHGDELNYTIYSPAKYKSPIPNENFPASQIDQSIYQLIYFELESDAVAFKVKWTEQ